MPNFIYPAIASGDKQMVKWVLEQTQQQLTHQHLSYAANSGNISLVEWMIKKTNTFEDFTYQPKTCTLDTCFMLYYLIEEKQYNKLDLLFKQLVALYSTQEKPHLLLNECINYLVKEKDVIPQKEDYKILKCKDKNLINSLAEHFPDKKKCVIC